MKRCLSVFVMIMISASVTLAAKSESISSYHPLSVKDIQVKNNSIDLTLGIEEPTWSLAGSANDPVTLTEIYSGNLLEIEGYPAVPDDSKVAYGPGLRRMGGGPGDPFLVRRLCSGGLHHVARRRVLPPQVREPDTALRVSRRAPGVPRGRLRGAR